jgi:hypothetical protein
LVRVDDFLENCWKLLNFSTIVKQKKTKMFDYWRAVISPLIEIFLIITASMNESIQYCNQHMPSKSFDYILLIECRLSICRYASSWAIASWVKSMNTTDAINFNCQAIKWSSIFIFSYQSYIIFLNTSLEKIVRSFRNIQYHLIYHMQMSPSDNKMKYWYPVP